MISNHCTFDCSGGLTIGDWTAFFSGAMVFTHNHLIGDKGTYWRSQGEVCKPLTIGSDVWVGANAIILSQAESIGNGAICGAGSVVTKTVAPYSIVAGNPARTIGVRE